MKPPNRFFLWSFPLFAIAAAVVTYLMAVSGASRSSTDVMKDFEADIALGGPSLESALFKIDMAFKLAVVEEDREQQALILKRRSKLYRDLRRFDRAQDDLELLLRKYTPDDQDSIRQLAKIEFDNGDSETALNRVQAELERDPYWVTGLVLCSEFQTDLAAQVLDECNAVCAGSMDDETAARAAGMNRIAATRLPSDPRRTATVYEITKLFPTGSEEELRDYTKLFAEASALYDAAIVNSVKCLERSNHLAAINTIRQILGLSEAYDLLDAFETANLLHFTREDSEYYLEKYVESLAAVGRHNDVVESFASFIEPGTKPKLGLLRQVVPSFYATESWVLLDQVAQQLQRENASTRRYTAQDIRIGTTLRSLSLLYRGIAAYRQGSFRPAAALLTEYINDPERAWPSAALLVEAETALARSLRELPEPAWRKPEAAVLASLLTKRSQAAGEDWIRLVELQRQLQVPAPVLENSLAHLMASLPERSAEFEPEWRAVGRSGVRQALLAPRPVKGSRDKTRSPVISVARSTLAPFTAAEQHASEGEWYSVLADCEQLFKLVPYFTPAVELYLQACVNLDLRNQGIELLLGRLEYLGEHTATIERLDALLEYLTPAQEVRFIQATSEAGARDLLAQSLVEQGKFKQVLIAFSKTSAEELSSGDSLLIGEAQLGLGRTQDALLSLRRVDPESPHYQRAFALLLQAAIETEDEATLDASIGELARPSAPIDFDLVPILDQLLVAGRVDLAEKLCTYLDSDVTTRSGKNMLRLAGYQMHRGEFEAATESLERAYAYRSDGGPMIGAVLIALANEDWDALPRLLADLDQDSSGLAIESRMGIALLRGRTQVVSDYLATLTPENQAKGLNLLLRSLLTVLTEPESPLLEEYPSSIQGETRAFLVGGRNDSRDPRKVIGLVLALQHSDWLGWLVRELPRWNSIGTNLWVELLKSETLLRLGALSKADETIARLVTRWPQFLPAWEVSNELQLMQPLEKHDLVNFAKRGWEAPGHPGALQLRTSLENIESLRRAGEFDQAMFAVRAALDSDPESPPLLYQLGKVNEAQGRYSAAVVALIRFLKNLPPVARNAVLPEVIDTIEQAAIRGDIDTELLQQSFRGLSVAFPRNALVALKFTATDLRADLVRSPVTAMQTAYERLAKFRTFTNMSPLSELGDGGLEAWHKFFLKFDPARCRKFLIEERLLTPTDPELWAMIAETLYAEGRFEEADEQTGFLVRIAPTARSLELWLASLIRRKSPLGPMEKACEMLAELKGWDLEHPELQLWMARARAGASGPARVKGFEELRSLWESRDDPEFLALLESPRESVVKIGREFGIAAMRSGDREQHGQAQKAFQLISEFPLPAPERRLYATLSHIGPHRSTATVPTAGRGQKATPDESLDSELAANADGAEADGTDGSERAQAAEPRSALPQVFTDQQLEVFDSLKRSPNPQARPGGAPQQRQQGASRNQQNRAGRDQ